MWNPPPPAKQSAECKMYAKRRRRRCELVASKGAIHFFNWMLSKTLQMLIDVTQLQKVHNVACPPVLRCARRRWKEAIT